MKSTDPIYVAIANWFNSRRDYDEGVDLYIKYGKNKSLKGMFPGREHRFARKLEYELSKIIGVDFLKISKLPAKPLPTITVQDKARQIVGKTETFDVPIIPHKLPDYEPEMPQVLRVDPGMQLPPVIRRAMYERHDLYVKRGQNHEALKKVPQGDTPGLNAQRAELSGLIAKQSKRMDELFQVEKEFQSSGTVPEETTLWPAEKPKVELDYAKLQEKKDNLQKSLSKDRNMLEFQAKIKAEVPKPMPKGPRRDKVEARIQLKEEEIAQINKALNDLTKAQ